MTLDELRAACERAKMDVCSHPDGSWSIMGATGHLLSPEDAEQHEWIEARCASLLTAEVLEVDEFMGDMEHRLLMEHPDQVLMAATDQQRIRAAMAVLGEW